MQDKCYLNSKEGYDNEMGRYRTKRTMNFIFKVLKKERKYKILDVGGGSGRISLELLKKHHDIQIIDLNPTALQLLPISKKLRIECIDFMSFETSEIFDILLLIETIVYFPSLQEVMLKVNKLLKPEGIVIFTGTNANSIRTKIRKLSKHITKHKRFYDYYNELTLSQYQRVLTNAGFSINQIEGFCWQPFKVNSNNILVRFFAFLEAKIFLFKWLKQSPFLLISAKKMRDL